MAKLPLGEEVLDRERVRQQVERAEPDARLADRLRDLVAVPQLRLEVGTELVVDHEPRARERNEPLDDHARELLLRIRVDAVVAALHGREPRALAGHVVEDEVRERAQQHRVVGAQRLLDRLGVLPALEDGENVGAARPAPERLRVVGVDEAEHEVRVAGVAVRVREARAFELGAEQLGETAERRRRRVAEERVLHRSQVVRHGPTINARARLRASARSA